MKLHASGEDYLETILVLQKKRGMVRSVDVARHMEVSKPSVCHAVANLRDGGFLMMDEDHFLHLTDVGREVAEKIYERHCFFTEQLIAAGVDPVDFFKKYETPAIHIKDITYNGMIPERICKVVGREYVWNDDAPCNFEFRTLGQGLHDVPRTIRAAVASGVKHIIVEQDLPTPGLTAMECAKRNIEYLRTFEF